MAAQLARVARGSAAAAGSRSYSLLSNLSKKTQEAVEKTKAAAEELQRAASTSQAAEQLKQQAAAAASTLGQSVAQAQEFASATAQEFAKGTSSGDKSHTENTTDSSGTSSDQGQQQPPEAGPKLGGRLRSFAAAALQEVRAVVLPEQPTTSALRGASAKAEELHTATTTELVTSRVAEGAWQQQWREMRERLGGHPMFARVRSLRDSRVFKAGSDAADSLRERWETSDSPLVHRIQDATDSLFAEGEAAQALREIRARDPNFDMVNFLQRLKVDVPTVLRAYLTGDEAAIAEHCSPEMVERLNGIARAQAAAGLVPDPTLLDTSDVELVDLKMLDDAPVLVTQFTCQQINCTRDSHGNVVEGAPDEVQRVYYYWALAQEAAGFVGEDGKYHPPRWRLREMLVRGMHALL